MTMHILASVYACSPYDDLERAVCWNWVSKVYYNKMKELHDKFDILLNCSLRDSGYFVVMEGMIRGLTNISVDTGDARINATKSTGLGIKSANSERMIKTMSNAINRLVKDKKLRTEMRKVARKHAIEHFNAKKRIQTMNELLL